MRKINILAKTFQPLPSNSLMNSCVLRLVGALLVCLSGVCLSGVCLSGLAQAENAPSLRTSVVQEPGQKSILQLSIDDAKLSATSLGSSALDEATFSIEHPSLSSASFSELTDPTRIEISIPDIEDISQLSAPFTDNPIFSRLTLKPTGDSLRLVIEMRRQYTPYYEWRVKGNSLSINVKQKREVALSSTGRARLATKETTKDPKTRHIKPESVYTVHPESEGITRPLSPAAAFKLYTPAMASISVDEEATPPIIEPIPTPTPTPVSTVHKGQTLEKIEFRQKQTGGTELFLKLSQQPQFKLTRTAPGEHTLIVPSSEFLSESLTLPYFAPQSAEGWVAVVADKKGDDITFRLVTNPSEKLRAYALADGIGVSDY
jgi:hypothetical protein